MADSSTHPGYSPARTSRGAPDRAGTGARCRRLVLPVAAGETVVESRRGLARGAETARNPVRVRREVVVVTTAIIDIARLWPGPIGPRPLTVVDLLHAENRWGFSSRVEAHHAELPTRALPTHLLTPNGSARSFP